MPRKTFDRDLQRLEDEVLKLGSMVETAVTESVRILKEHDHKAAQRLVTDDRFINEKRYAIESDALRLIATQQPLAADLRTLAGILVIVNELERMGDYAKGIAKVTLMMGDAALLEPIVDIPHMADKVREMLHQALEAFVRLDVDLARSIPQKDQHVDALHNRIYRQLLGLITSDPGCVDRASYLLWVAHNLERTADRVINICERVVFTATGEMTEMDVTEGQALGLESLS